MLENALMRLDGALAQLEAAARRRVEAERGRANLETELALMQDDRARLAAELDGATARLGDVETAAADVDQRLERAMNVIGAVIARAQPEAEPLDAAGEEMGEAETDYPEPTEPGPGLREPSLREH
jgi:predicted  nucleic acid-binding Zn-ribbon protein